jgi:hypothetical protein
MNDVLSDLRRACGEVATRARHVKINVDSLAQYARSLPPDPPVSADTRPAEPEARCAFWLTLDAINFGSGWFPTLRKPSGFSGYDTVAAGIRGRFRERGAWDAAELAVIDAREVASVLGQDPGHELMALFAASLNDLGARVLRDFDGRFDAVADAAGGSAVRLATLLGSWACFRDVSRYGELEVPFLKRAQIAAADLTRAGAITPGDLSRLTIFADNLVPHVLRIDGILSFDPELVARIEREELLEHGSAEEVEIRACALHAVELIVERRPGSTAAQLDQLLWNRGREPRYKSRPRHRSRCTAY